MKICKLTNKIFFSLIFLFISFIVSRPNFALAATAYLTTSLESVAVGDTVIVNVKLDPLGQKPNVIEGDITIQAGAEKIKISKLSTAGSVLTFWPQNPSLDQPSSISFNGGVPGGFDKPGSLLFKIGFLAEAEGEVVFLSSNFKVYNNDGQASLLDVSATPLTIVIGPKGDRPAIDQWQDIITTDKKAPQNLMVTAGQDSVLFAGKKFINIYAVDDESGIDYYEVTEGDRPAVRSGDTYVFQDQSLKSLVTVKAIDKAGNVSVAKYEPEIVQPNVQPVENTQVSQAPLIFGSIILVLILGILVAIIIKIKNKNVGKNKKK